MSWQDRLQEAAYTASDGVRLVFQWEAVTRETEKRTTAFDFPGVFNSYVQDNGSGSRKYPMRAIFHGENCDVEATTFERACLRTGVGQLEHPVYGTFPAIPFGSVKRTDDPIEAGNVSSVEVTFWTTTDAVYPSSQGNPRNEIVASLAAFNAAGAQQFSDAMQLTTVAQKAGAATSVRSLLTTVNGSLSPLTDAVGSLKSEFNAAQSAILNSMDTLIETPAALALAIAELVQLPATAALSFAARLASFADLAESIFVSNAGSPETALASGVVLPRRNVTVANDFHTADVIASSAIAGTIRSALETTYTTRPQAVAAANDVLEQFDALVAWRDASFAALGDAENLLDSARVDTGGSYQAIREAAMLVAGYLVETSFTLVPERRVVLDRNRTIVDLAAELYGSVDERLDFLIETNDLSGSEILELPAGREIVYYPVAA